MGELFPAAEVRSFLATETCFYCDVNFPFEFESEMIPLLEERMRGWIMKDLPFKQLDMMPSNAAQFLKHHKNPRAAEIVRGQAGIVDYPAGQFCWVISRANVGEHRRGEVYKIANVQKNGSWIRLIGTAAFSKDELKLQVKHCKNIPNHLTLIKEKQLLSPCPKGWLWLPKGELLKKMILDKTFQLFSGIDAITTPALNEKDLTLCHSSYIKATGRGSAELIKMSLGGEGLELVDTAEGIVDRIFLPGKEESVISFLQIITKFLKIFAFEYEVVIVGNPAKILREALKKSQIKSSSENGEQSGIEFLISDALGRMWTGPRIFFDDRSGVVGLSLFYSLERFVALLLEKEIA